MSIRESALLYASNQFFVGVQVLPAVAVDRGICLAASCLSPIGWEIFHVRPLVACDGCSRCRRTSWIVPVHGFIKGVPQVRAQLYL
eukprot:6189271-Pleurochrysis_carterae.AAC.1